MRKIWYLLDLDRFVDLYIHVLDRYQSICYLYEASFGIEMTNLGDQMCGGAGV